jgi:hypothetical protein
MVKVVQSYKMARIYLGEKEVEPDGHGEASHDHELNLHELTSVFYNHRILTHPLS